MPKPFSISAQSLAGGYYSQVRNRKPIELAPPSQNVRMTLLGQAYSRPGFTNTGWTIGSTSAGMTTFRMTRYALTFFAVPGDFLYYRKDSDGNVYSTGIALTAGTQTMMAEFQGDIWLTNSTDGITHLFVTTVKTAVSAGGATVACELGTAFRSPAASNLRIKGTDEAYSSRDTATDIYTLTGTSSQAYAAGEIVVVVEALSSLPKGSKLFFFYERMGVIGVTSDSNTQAAARWTVFFGQFQNPNIWANIKTFDYATLGSDRESIGSAGVITNAITTQSYLYVFKENETYFVPYSDITATGASAGKTPFKLLTNQYGCVNQFCASDMEGFAVFLSKNKRIVKSTAKLLGNTTALVPDESFDRPIREEIIAIDDDQTNARMWYHRARKLLFVQVRVGGQSKTFVYDNNLGVWLPPDTNKNFNSYCEYITALYATDANTNTVYQVETGASDDGAYIDTIIASGVLIPSDRVQTSDWDEIVIKGRIGNSTTITYTPYISGTASKAKTITISDAKVSSMSQEVGSVLVGSSAIGSDSIYSLTNPFYKRFKIYPSVGQDYQHKFEASGDGQSFEIDAFSINAKVFADPFLISR